MHSAHCGRSRILVVLLSLALLQVAGISSAATLEVGAAYTYPTIQAAVTAASTGDTIIVHPGTYAESVQVVAKDLHIRSEDPDSSAIRDATIVSGTNSLLVLSGTTSSCIVEGLTFSGGTGSSATIYMMAGGATIRKNVITGADVSDAGGGILCLAASGTIDSNIISSNQAAVGGGIYAEESSLTISNNTIDSNVAKNCAGSGGGGLHLTGGGIYALENNTISNNSATSNPSYGGALYARDLTGLTLSGNTFTANSAPWRGAAYILSVTNTVIVSNNMVQSNTCGAGLPGMSLESCNATVTGNTFDNNRTTGIGPGALACASGNFVLDSNVITNNAGTAQSAGGLDLWNVSSCQVTNNTITGNTGQQAGGILCGSNTTISGNTITDNTSLYAGGGISSAYHTGIVVSSNTISRNTATLGGGIYFSDASFQVNNNTIEDNTATTGAGGGAYLNAVSSTVSGNTFTGNTAQTRGGGVWSSTFYDDRSIALSNNTYDDNHAVGSPGTGGGIAAARNVTLTNETITNCSALGNGGGIYLGIGFPASVIGCSISGCSAVKGGGIAASASPATIQNCSITGNTATSLGGGLWQDSSTTITGCTIIDNSAPTGGAIEQAGGTMSLLSCLIAGNSATSSDPGVRTNRDATIGGCTFARNAGPGADLHIVYNFATTTITNCIFASGCQYGIDNDASFAGFTTVGYSCFYGHSVSEHSGFNPPLAADGNLFLDPLFADVAGGDYHLKSRSGRWEPSTSSWVLDSAFSPCVDAADPASDFSMEPAFNGGRRNMGFYGNTAEASKGDEPPSSPTVDLTPNSPITSDDLTMAAVGSSDPEGAPIAYDYRWYLDDVLQTAFNDVATVPAVNTTRGQTWRCEARAKADWKVSDWESDQVTILNATPSVASVEISPEPAYPTSTLTATPSGWSDADGDAEDYVWLWEVDSGSGFSGILGETTSTLAPGNFEAGDTVRVTATPSDGTITGVGVTDTILITRLRTLTLNWAGAGSVLVDGTPRTLPCQVEVPEGSAVTVVPVPIAGWELHGWSGDVPGGWSTDSPLQVTMTGNRSITPHFRLDGPTLTINKPAAGMVMVNGVLQTLPFSRRFASGTTVTLVSLASSGWEHDRWLGDIGLADARLNTLQVVMDGDRTVTPTFKMIKRALNIGWAGAGSVLVNGTPQALPFSGMFPLGSAVTVEPVPTSGWDFHCWSGDVPPENATDAPLTLTMDGDRAIRPHFCQRRTLTIEAAAAGVVRVNGTVQSLPYTGRFMLNSTVRVEALANSGYAFDQWSGDYPEGGRFEPLISVAMSSDRTIRPHFKAAPAGAAQLMSVSACATSGGAEISFTLSAPASVSAEVLNIAGRTVRQIVVDRAYESGPQSLAWNGVSDLGTHVPSGTYLIRVTARGDDGARCERISTVQVR